MKLAMISFTDRGSRLLSQLLKLLETSGYDCEGYAISRYALEYDLKEPEGSLGEWTKTMFQTKEAILFIGAAGIAVRAIAPYVKDKMTDPAVLVMDERGIFAISLLSGHLGGANELAGVLANLTGAIPVITTATDVNGKFAVDVFAKKNRLQIGNRVYAKEISAEILEEQPVGFYSEFPVIGQVPEELTQVEMGEPFDGAHGFVIALNEEKNPFVHTLHLYPKIVTLGVGCRKGTDPRVFSEEVLKVLRKNHISMESVEEVISIDLKAEEEAILSFCREHALKFTTCTAEELMSVEGTFTASEFVMQVTGADNICERSAVFGSSSKRLIQKKTAAEGVTIAIAVRDWSVDFG